jgi:hypothetical protein
LEDDGLLVQFGKAWEIAHPFFLKSLEGADFFATKAVKPVISDFVSFAHG